MSGKIIETAQPAPNLVGTRILRINAVALAVVIGLVCGAGLFTATNWLVIKDGKGAGPHLALLGQVFIGYRVTVVGSLIGFAYACATGYVAAYCGAVIYNRVADWQEARQRRSRGRRDENRNGAGARVGK